MATLIEDLTAEFSKKVSVQEGKYKIIASELPLYCFCQHGERLKWDMSTDFWYTKTTNQPVFPGYTLCPGCNKKINCNPEGIRCGGSVLVDGKKVNGCGQPMKDFRLTYWKCTNPSCLHSRTCEQCKDYDLRGLQRPNCRCPFKHTAIAPRMNFNPKAKGYMETVACH